MTWELSLISPTLGTRDLTSSQHQKMRGGSYQPDANGVITWTLLFTGVDADDAVASYRAVEAMLLEASSLAFAGNRGQFVQLAIKLDTTRRNVYYLRGGTLTAGVGYGRNVSFQANIAFQTLDPQPYGDRQTFDVTSTLTNGSAVVLLEDVGGDTFAPLRLQLSSVSGTIAGYRVGVRPVPPGTVAADWTPVVNLSQVTSGNTADAGSVGGSIVSRSITAVTEMAQATQPAGDLNQGRMHAFLRGSDTPTAPTVAVPTGFALGADENPSEDVDGVPGNIRRRQQKSGSSANNTTASKTVSVGFDSTTLAGSALLAWVGVANDDDDGSFAITPPSSDWIFIRGMKTPDDAGSAVEDSAYGALFIFVDAGTMSTTPLDWDIDATAVTGSWQANVIMVEVTGARAENPIDAFDMDTVASGTDPTYSISTNVDGCLVLYFGESTGTGNNQLSVWLGGATERRDADGLFYADQLVTTAGGGGGVIAIAASNRDRVIAAIALRPILYSVSSSAGLPALDPGTYSAVVQTQDVNGNLSAPTSVETISAGEGGYRRLHGTWSDATGHVAYVFSWGKSNTFRQMTVLDPEAFVYSMEDGAPIAALPTTGSVSSRRSRHRLRVGTADQQLSQCDTFVMPLGATVATTYAGTVDLPSIAAGTDASRPDWGVLTEAESGNVDAATVKHDSLWLFSAEPESSFATMYANADIGPDVVYELRPDGQVVAWMEDDDARYSMTVIGQLFLKPGANLLHIEALGTGDSDGKAFVSSLSRTFTALASYLPHYTWQAGGAV
jgi:hypothetical protein